MKTAVKPARVETVSAPPLAIRILWRGDEIWRLDLTWAENVGPTDARSDAGRELARCLADYVAGRNPHWPDLPLTFSNTAPFHRRCWEELAKIPYGQTLTYAELAERAGSAQAARAVGQAMAKNPFPLVYPCHRVLASGGGLGGYGPGLEMKKWLLALESGKITPLTPVRSSALQEA
ncbi:methylated-DNA--[protein]-cysteine S-methyltransferase [Fundidesulfovibrio butyratiphilus]